MKKKNILVTGAGGFIGQYLLEALAERGYPVTGMQRLNTHDSDVIDRHGHKVSYYSQEEIISEEYWEGKLEDIDIVIHLAGRAHILGKSRNDPEDEYYRVNTEFTRAIVYAAVRMKVKKVVFLSTIGVHGKHSRKEVVTEETEICLDTPYAKSKMQAEECIQEACSGSENTRFVILRPPLVYGRYAKGNYIRLIKWIKSGLPLPFGMINNKRSVIHAYNLCNIIMKSLEGSDLDNEVFVVSDGRDVSTRGLVTEMCKQLSVKCIIIPVPPLILKMISFVARKQSMVDSLIGDYRVCTDKLCERISCEPVISFEDGIRESVEWCK